MQPSALSVGEGPRKPNYSGARSIYPPSRNLLQARVRAVYVQGRVVVLTHVDALERTRPPITPLTENASPGRKLERLALMPFSIHPYFSTGRRPRAVLDTRGSVGRANRKWRARPRWVSIFHNQEQEGENRGGGVSGPQIALNQLGLLRILIGFNPRGQPATTADTALHISGMSALVMR